MSNNNLKKYVFSIGDDSAALSAIVEEVAKTENLSYEDILKVLQKHPSSKKKIFSKSQIYLAYPILKKNKLVALSPEYEKNFLRNIRMKKVRTISGVTPVTLLTKPFPCPGRCIYCPSDVRMPKSYLSDEPGAQRASANHFDPYLQTFNRLVAYRNMGHPTEKVEIIILGGTWTHYPEAYQIWFVKRCFDALNDFGDSKNIETLKVKTEMLFDESKLKEIDGTVLDSTYNQVITRALLPTKSEFATWAELDESHRINETTKSRCVGLVIETRPDEITEDALIRIRRLGATKVQLGIQSLNDEVLDLNKRGHTSDTTRNAIDLIRMAGFKIHGHWMPNLYGSTPEKDKEDYHKLFSDGSVMPDELKVYPCSLLATAELMQYFNEGKWKPYSENELLDVLREVFISTPRYCRLTRVIRDIPSTNIVEGNKKTNFRQTVEKSLLEEGIKPLDIRSREIKGMQIKSTDLDMKITKYNTSVTEEYFIEFITSDDEIAGFLRLAIPLVRNVFEELRNEAIIREVHVYGQSIELGDKKEGKAQHTGLGKKLMAEAEKISRNAGFVQIAVITAIGTREYYRKLGYTKKQSGDLFLHKKLN